MYCTDCLGKVYEVGFDVWEGGEERQFSGCFCGEISSIVLDYEDEHNPVKLVGIGMSPEEQNKLFRYSYKVQS